MTRPARRPAPAARRAHRLLGARHDPAEHAASAPSRSRALLLGAAAARAARRLVAPHRAASPPGTILVKAIVLPGFLRWAIREAAVRREVEPLIGFIASLLLGARGGGARVRDRRRGCPPPDVTAALLIPVALATVIDRADRAHHAAQGAHAGGGLPDARERHLPLRPQPGGARAVPGRGRRAARRVRRRVHHGHRRVPHQSRVRFARLGAAHAS